MDLAERIAELVQTQDGPNAKRARDHGALEVHADWGGFLSIRPDLSAWIHAWETGRFEPATGSWELAARVSAGKRFPELAALLPARPGDAPDCRLCGGSGVIPHGRDDPPHTDPAMECVACSGLGWEWAHFPA